MKVNMRRVSICFIFIFVISSLFAEQKIYNNGYKYLFISAEDIEITSDEELNKDRLISGHYELESRFGLTYITVNDSRTFLMLISEDLIYLYEEDGYPFYFGVEGKKRSSIEGFISPESKTSSFLIENLKEGPIEYKSKNLNSNKIPNPWVEGVQGNGIGEKIYLSKVIPKEYRPSLFILNGYISYNRPDLYKKNSRVKKIKLTYGGSDIVEFIDLLDKPDPQEIPLIKQHNGEIMLEIIEVYPGELYEDTCINLIALKEYSW